MLQLNTIAQVCFPLTFLNISASAVLLEGYISYIWVVAWIRRSRYDVAIKKNLKYRRVNDYIYPLAKYKKNK